MWQSNRGWSHGVASQRTPKVTGKVPEARKTQSSIPLCVSERAWP